MQFCGHLIRPDAVTILSRFFNRIGTKTNHFSFYQHVKTIAISQRFRNFNIQMIFRHVQHFAHRQADKFRRIKCANITFTCVNKIVGTTAIEHATPTSPWQPTSAPEIEAFIL